MENPTTLSAPLAERCDGCFKEIIIDDVFCVDCGYPIKGTAKQQANFISKRDKADVDLVAFNNRMTKRISKAGNTLFWLSGLFVLGGLIAFFKLKDDPDVLAIAIPYFVLGIVFLLLGEYSKKKTLACFVSGLCLYIILQAIDFVQHPNFNLLSFVIIGIIIGALVMGVKSAIEIEKFKKENNLS